MPRGGDRRAIVRPEGRDLACASLLMQELCADSSEAGVRFNTAREVLFRRWERLIRALARHRVAGWAGPPSTLGRVEEYLRMAALASSVHYPKPRHLTSQEEAELLRHDNAAGDSLQALYMAIGPEVDDVGIVAGSACPAASGACHHTAPRGRLMRDGT